MFQICARFTLNFHILHLRRETAVEQIASIWSVRISIARGTMLERPRSPNPLCSTPDTRCVYFQAALFPVCVNLRRSDYLKLEMKPTQHPVNFKIQHNSQTYDCK